MSLKRRKRYKLLLDEGLYLSNTYPNLNKLHDLLHVSKTKYRGSSDKVIYNFSNKESRIPIVHNIKHFVNLMDKDKISVIWLSNNVSNKHADSKIVKALNRLKPSEIKGRLISITNQEIVIRKIIAK